MKNLKGLLHQVVVIQLWGNPDIRISGFQYDSRKIKPNNCFFAIGGFKRNGLDFLPQAIENGANSVISELPRNQKYKHVTWIQVENIRMAMSQLAAQWTDNPSKKMQVIGVTGTNGKTTVVSLIHAILNSLEPTAKMGTLGLEFQPLSGGDPILEKTSLTTPEAPDIFRFLSRIIRQGCQNMVMEVSSVGLRLNRVEDVCFSQGIFTSFSGDHLDFHKTMDSYFDSKLMLFKRLGSEAWAILNADEVRSCQKIIGHLNCKYLTYGFSSIADIKPSKFSFSLDGIRSVVETPRGKIEIESSLIGRVNLLNILAAIGSAIIKEIPDDVIVRAIKSFKPVRGRLDFTYRNDFSVLIDYAHTDQALKHLLKSLKEIAPGRLILLFGAGGSRDKSKRPRMGKIASTYADYVVVTSDNPRNEEPEKIIRDIKAGFKSGFSSFTTIVNRKEAIEQALELVKTDDLLVIAGKGHEDYQIFKDQTIHFDDYEVVRQQLKNRGLPRGSRHA
jgi:UDP-N-acetylmuramoyl-L-alanyl-D-glutamate--2,6-diaminopimelate ligase